ncbi:alpha/beta hydrolase family protein [Wenxinia marina]|uniref:Uncharacterized protein n=1 Tax=Wenxinia marina DSM 24838 TaxID=1123501 RepID=A0A0D0PEI3_9RHOB|nr:hypothetical protein [Wenxinia marina]KIQ69816.1 hypothetical protein Wenmar_01386 [Wenxinia marina DSM 24838]
MKRTLIAALAATVAAPALAQEAPYPVLRSAAEGLDGYTLYAPQGLADAPAVLWFNGGCVLSHAQATALIVGVAEQGYAVLATGAPGDYSTDRDGPRADKVGPMIDWLEGAGAGQLGAAPSAIGTMGWSCGGAEALLGGAEPRVDAILGLATGFFTEPDESRPPEYGIENLGSITQPTMIAAGGPSDIAWENANANFDQADFPMILVGHESAGHGGLVTGAYEGQGVEVQALADSIALATDWLDWQLKGDEATGQAAFLAEDCTWCAAPWSVETKGF